MKQGLTTAWYDGSRWPLLLWPLSLLYGLLAAARRIYLLRSSPYRASVPVLVVGNITAGGTGKTPVCLALARYFTAQGQRVVLVSRGYGGQGAGYPLLVTPDSDPATAGDEAVLLAQASGCAVVVDPDRVRAVQLAERRLQASLIISDDGLQHYALARTLELAVVDGERGLGNGLLLPAGPLREPSARLAQVEGVIVNGSLCAPLPVTPARLFAMQLQVRALVNLVSGEQLTLPAWFERFGRSARVHAVAGIGNPSRFFTSLQQLGFVIMPHAFADHHAYQAGELDFADGATLIMTSKDAVKCRPFAREHWWVLEVEAELPVALLEILQCLLVASPVAGHTLHARG